MIRSLILAWLATSCAFAQLPGPTNGTTLLPNGWSISPVGRHLSTPDYVLGLSPSPDGRVLVGLHSGFNPHGLVVTQPDGSAILQRIPLRSSWMGLAWPCHLWWCHCGELVGEAHRLHRQSPDR